MIVLTAMISFLGIEKNSGVSVITNNKSHSFSSKFLLVLPLLFPPFVLKLTIEAPAGDFCIVVLT